MVRPANTSSASAGGKRKRLEYDDPRAAAISKKRYEEAVRKSPERSQTPGKKNARFDKVLIKEATPAPPLSGRSQSPVRPIRKISNTDDGPSAQLHAEELRASQDRATSPRRRSKQSPARRKASPQRGSSGLTWMFDEVNLLKDSQRNTASTARHRQLRDEYEADAEDDAVQPVLSPDADIAISPVGYSTDSYICDKVNTMRELAMDIAKTCPRLRPNQSVHLLDHLLQRENEKLVRYIGCLAMGGPKGEAGWRDLLGDHSCRQALVFGIIGRALTEHVFSELYFGGSPNLIEKLNRQEEKLTHLDGFERTMQRATEIRNHKTKNGDKVNFWRAVARVTLQLQHLLLPLWNPDPVTNGPEPDLESLARIVSTAGELSRQFRETHDVVYYWPPTFKDEEFEPSRMECFNLKSMISESPYDKKETNGIERAVLRASQEDRSEAIVRIVCFPSLVAYRQGGDELADQELADEEEERMTRESREKLPADVKRYRKMLQSQEQKTDRGSGFRTHVISKSVVWLEWGKQRLLTKEAGTSRHINAMKENDGQKYKVDYLDFKELYQLWEEKLNEDKPAPGILGRFFSRSPSVPTSKEAESRSSGRPVSRGKR